MTKKFIIKTPAKINLSLEIVDKLPNGYHSLSTVMQTVSLFDTLTVEKDENSSENQIILSGNNPNIPYDEKNIVYKVLKLFLEKINCNSAKIRVNIEKNIPTEAGLAGGSANGAGALIAVNELFNNILPKEELHKIASQTGSDLNFCLEGGACLLSSRGEIIDKKLTHRDFNVVIIKPVDIAISTPLCYKKFSEKYFIQKESYYSQKICKLFKENFNVKKLSELLYNDLEKPAIDLFPELQEIKNVLLKAGCHNALMSGSGSSIFGIYEGEIDLKPKDNWQIFYAKAL